MSSTVQRVMVMVFIYRIFYVHIQMRFTLLQCQGEIGQQHMSISDLIQPTQPMNHEIAQRPDQHTGFHALLVAISVWVLSRPTGL